MAVVLRQVGLRDLKNHLGDVLRDVRRGEIIRLTDRNRPVALLVPLKSGDAEGLVRSLILAGRLSWSGGKPRGSARPTAIRGPSVSDAVIEDRR